MGFPDQLKKARLASGLTQQQIADAMGITNSTYCGYETGKRQPDVAKIKQLANILHTSGDILLETGYGITEDITDDKKLIEATGLFKSLRPSFQDFALEQLKRLTELQDK